MLNFELYDPGLEQANIKFNGLIVCILIWDCRVTAKHTKICKKKCESMTNRYAVGVIFCCQSCSILNALRIHSTW